MVAAPLGDDKHTRKQMQRSHMGIYKCRSMLEDLDYKIILLDDVALLASRYTCILAKSIRLQALQVSLD